MRGLLLTTIAISVLVAGCAETGGEGGTGAPLATPSNAEAATLFAAAAGNVPDKFGLDMRMARNGTDLMTASAVFDGAQEIGYFEIKMDPSLMEDAGGMEASMMFGQADNIAIYSSPQGSAFVMDDVVILAPPDDENPMMSGASEQDGFGQLMDPEAFLGELKDENVTVTSVTSTTLRGKPALKLDTTTTDEEGTHNVTIYLFQDPTRVARIETALPADEDEDEQFAGATMTMDILYDNEISVEIPENVARVLGLRYQSDREMFGGFGGGSSGEDNVETWTFQVDSGIALAEVDAEVRESMGSDTDAPPEWTMKLSEGSKTVDTMTVAYNDADGDGKVSQGDTLTITRGDGTEGTQVSLKDTVTGLRVVPGPGAFLALVALAGALLVARRR